MPAPLLGFLAFTGLLGGRELVRRRGAARLDQSNLNALQTLSGGGQLGINGMGPPTPLGLGETDLTDQQINVTQAMSMGDSSAALAQAIKFAEQNQQQENFDDQLGLQNQRLDQQRDTFMLNNERFEFEQEKFQFGKDVSAQKLAIANRTLEDPEFAERQSIIEGRETFPVFDQLTQAFEVVPVRQTERFRQEQANIDNVGNLLGDLNRVRTLTQQLGGDRNPRNPGVRELQSLHTSVLLQLKDQFELGALAGPDLGLLLQRFPDPTALDETFRTDPFAIDQAFRSLSENVSQDLSTKLQGVRNWRGLDPRVLGRAQQNLFGAQRRDQEQFQLQTQELSSQAQAAQIPGSTISNTIGTLFGDPAAAQNLGQRQALGQADLGVESAVNQSVVGALRNPAVLGSVVGGGLGFNLLSRFLSRR